MKASMKASLKRPADLVARYGGEEFACLLPDTELPGAMVVAQQLGAAVQALQIEHADSAASAVVSAGLGLCCKPVGTPRRATGPKVDGPAALLGQADAQLYLAKFSGRGRVCGAELLAS